MIWYEMILKRFNNMDKTMLKGNAHIRPHFFVLQVKDRAKKTSSLAITFRKDVIFLCVLSKNGRSAMPVNRQRLYYSAWSKLITVD